MCCQSLKALFKVTDFHRFNLMFVQNFITWVHVDSCMKRSGTALHLKEKRMRVSTDLVDPNNEEKRIAQFIDNLSHDSLLMAQRRISERISLNCFEIVSSVSRQFSQVMLDRDTRRHLDSYLLLRGPCPLQAVLFCLCMQFLDENYWQIDSRIISPQHIEVSVLAGFVPLKIQLNLISTYDGTALPLQNSIYAACHSFKSRTFNI